MTRSNEWAEVRGQVSLQRYERPPLFGLLHNITGGWTVPFVMLLGVLALQLTTGTLTGNAGYV